MRFVIELYIANLESGTLQKPSIVSNNRIKNEWYIFESVSSYFQVLLVSIPVLVHLDQWAKWALLVARRLSSFVNRPLTFIKKNSSLNIPGLIKTNFAKMIIGICNLKNMSEDPANQPRWRLWLKIQQRVKIRFVAYISATKSSRVNLTIGKNG